MSTSLDLPKNINQIIRIMLDGCLLVIILYTLGVCVFSFLFFLFINSLVSLPLLYV